VNGGAHIVAAEVVTALGPSLSSTWEALVGEESGIAEVSRFDTGGYVSDFAAHIGGLEAVDGGAGSSLVHALLEPLLKKIEAEFELPADALLYTATTKAGIDLVERKLRGSAVNGEELTFAVLVVGFDVITEFVFSGFSALRALSPTPCAPFDRDRQGLTLGDGAAGLLVMSGERARREGRRSLGRISGWGVANDATHVTAPARNGSGLILASTAALKRAKSAPDKVGALFAHGTGTVYNDAMELTGFSEVFGGYENKLPPLFGVKGSLGHTMGGAGAIEAALSLKILEQRLVPATVGLNNPEERGVGWVTTEAVELKSPAVLTTNSGFGGVNGALLVQGGEP
jgi:3-oxoacyl-[acyl-carrier-protein] synthase II